MAVTDSARSASLRTTAAATAGFLATSMPAFLTGAMGVLVRTDLGFDEAGLGTAVSAFFATFALTSVVGGRIAERIGASRALRVAATLSALTQLLIAVRASNWGELVGLLAIAGVANGLAEPATSLALAKGATVSQALMFGIKQSATPMVTLVAGAMLPVVGVTVGWRWAFGFGSLVAATIAILMPQGLGPPSVGSASSPVSRPNVRVLPLVSMAIAMGMGTAAAVSLPSFLVESIVDDGVRLTTAGWMLSAGSVAGIVARLAVGRLADRRTSSALPIMSVMLILGAVGFLLLGHGSFVGLLALGSVVAYACGFGWSGLTLFAVAHLNSEAPAKASGIVLTGAAAGASIGPFAFGWVASTLSFTAAWNLTAGLALLSATMAVFAGRGMVRSQPQVPPHVSAAVDHAESSAKRGSA